MGVTDELSRALTSLSGLITAADPLSVSFERECSAFSHFQPQAWTKNVSGVRAHEQTRPAALQEGTLGQDGREPPGHRGKQARGSRGLRPISSTGSDDGPAGTAVRTPHTALPAPGLQIRLQDSCSAGQAGHQSGTTASVAVCGDHSCAQGLLRSRVGGGDTEASCRVAVSFLFIVGKRKIKLTVLTLQ